MTEQPAQPTEKPHTLLYHIILRAASCKDDVLKQKIVDFFTPLEDQRTGREHVFLKEENALMSVNNILDKFMDALIGAENKIFVEHVLKPAIQEHKKDDPESLEEKPELEIWELFENGSKKLLIHNLAQNIIDDYAFLTIGDYRPKMLIYRDGVYTEGGEREIAILCEKKTEGLISNHQVLEIQKQIQRNTFIDREALYPQDIELLCVGNGILNLQTRELTPHSHRILFAQKINWDYIPGSKCDRIKSFLADVIEPENMDCFQEYCGYMLHRRYDFKKAAILMGPRDSGKTTVIKLLTEFIGPSNISGVSLHAMAKDRFAAAGMQYKLMNCYDDLSSGDLNDTSAFKMATGGGYMTGEKKFGDQFQFLNYAKMLFSTNKFVGVKDVNDDAYYDRWIILFFNNRFRTGRKEKRVEDEEYVKDANPNLIDELTTPEEMSGFINWCLDGLDRLLRQGHFSYTRTVEQNKNLMLKDVDTVFSFWQDCLELSDGLWVSKDDFFNMYVAYCGAEGLPCVTKEKLGREASSKLKLQESKKDCLTAKSVRGWLNVGIKAGKAPFFINIYGRNKPTLRPKNPENDALKFVHMTPKKDALGAFEEKKHADFELADSENSCDEKKASLGKDNQNITGNGTSKSDTLSVTNFRQIQQAVYEAIDSIGNSDAELGLGDTIYEAQAILKKKNIIAPEEDISLTIAAMKRGGLLADGANGKIRKRFKDAEIT